jgi:hypothetical protein
LSCTVKTSTSSIVWLPAKSTSSQSGYVPPVPSCQPPPFAQFAPVRSPLMAPPGANALLKDDDALAVAPFAAAATFTPPALLRATGGICGAVTATSSPPHATRINTSAGIARSTDGAATRSDLKQFNGDPECAARPRSETRDWREHRRRWEYAASAMPGKPTSGAR